MIATMVKKALGWPSAKRMRAAVHNNAQTSDSANKPDIPPNPGETDDPDVSPGPHDDLGALGPSQFMTTLVPAVVVPPPPPGEDPPDAPAEPDPFTDASGSPNPPRSGEAPGPGDGPDNPVEVVDADGNQPPVKTPGSLHTWYHISN
jgi:hypothetical protein